MADVSSVPDEELAERVARRLAQRVRPEGGWQTILACCWEAVRDLPTEYRGNLSSVYRACYYAVVNQYRRETHRGRLNRLQVRFGIGSAPARPEAVLTVPARPPEERLLAVWCETAHMRSRCTWVQRLYAYLYFVEGLSQVEIGSIFCVWPQLINYHVRQFSSKVSYVRSRLSGVGQVDGGGPAGGGAGRPVEHAGDAPEGDPPGGPSGDGRAGSDAGGVAPGGGPVDRSGCRADGRGAAHLHRGAGPGGVCDPGQALQPDDGRPGAGLVPADTQTARRPGRRSVGAVVELIPVDTGAKAAALRASMLDGIGADDVQEVVAKITSAAKAGDMRAAKLLLSLLGAK